MTETLQQMDTADTAPEGGAEVATLDWVLDHIDRTVMPVVDGMESAVLGAAWALGFAGATRVQVWWVLRDARLRTAFVSICNAMGRVRPADLPEWVIPVVQLPPAERTVLARHTEQMLEEGTNRVPAELTELFEVFGGHPDAVVAPDRRYVVVSRAALAELTEIARSVTVSDIARLLDRARDPFERRLAEAATVASEPGATFHSRRARRAVAEDDDGTLAPVRRLSTGP